MNVTEQQICIAQHLPCCDTQILPMAPRQVLPQVRLAYTVFTNINDYISRSQWPRGLRGRSVAARLLRLWVRIPPGTWMSVAGVVYCQVEVFATSRSLVQRIPTDRVASFRVIYKFPE